MEDSPLARKSITKTEDVSSVSTPTQSTSYGPKITNSGYVIIEIGCRYIRAGFSGEAHPRCHEPIEKLLILPTASSLKDNNILRESKYWSDNIYSHDDDGHFLDRLELLFRNVYSRYLMANPKHYRVLIVEDFFLPVNRKAQLAQALFQFLQVPYIGFLASSLMSTIAAGLRSALIIDIGWHETRVYPVYDLRLLIPFSSCTHVGCQLLHNTISDSFREILGCTSSFDEIESFIMQGCFCGVASDENEAPYSLDSETIVPSNLRHELVQQVFLGHDGIPSMHSEDSNAHTMVNLIIQCLLQLPVDVRGELQSKIVFVGGGSQIPGLKAAILSGLRKALSSHYQEIPSRLSETPNTRKIPYKVDFDPTDKVSGYDSLGSWTGASLYGNRIGIIYPPGSVQLEHQIQRDRFLRGLDLDTFDWSLRAIS